MLNLNPSLVTNLRWTSGEVLRCLTYNIRAWTRYTLWPLPAPAFQGTHSDFPRCPDHLSLLFQLTDVSLHFYRLGELFQDFLMQTCRKTCVIIPPSLYAQRGKGPFAPAPGAAGLRPRSAQGWSRGQGKSVPRGTSQVIDIRPRPAFVSFFLLTMSCC